MMQGAMAGDALGNQWAQNPNIGFGGSGEHSLLSNLDPIGNQITKLGGDPLNLYGNKNNPNALLFPSGSGTNGTQTTFPNLGAASMIPQMPQGSFGAIHNGAGPYNAMAAAGAGGQTFNPAGTQTQGGPKPSQAASNGFQPQQGAASPTMPRFPGRAF